MMANTRHWTHNGPNQDSVAAQVTVAVNVEQETSICRGCLSTESRMFNAMTFADSFKDLTGITISPTDGLPQWLCYECTALLHECVQFRNKIMKSHNRLCQYVLESVPLEEQIDDTDEHDTEMLSETAENVQVKDERVFSNHEDNIDEEEHREVTPPREIVSDAASISNEVKKEEEYTTTECTETSNYAKIKQTEAARVETLVVTEAARPSLKARLRFDDHSYARVPKESTFTTAIHSYVDATEIDIQEHFLEQSFMKFEVENPSDRDDYTCDYVIYGNSHQKYYKSDATLLHNHDNAEEDVKCNIYEDGSVNSSSRSNVQSYICDARNECIRDENLLKSEHTCEHSAEKSFKCDVCYKRFSDYSTLTKHSRVHTAAKLYHCDFCKKCYRHKRNVIRHLRKHSNEKLYSGDVSDKRSNSDASNKRYKCDICMKAYGQKSHLNTHMYVHTGNKPYKCEVCMKRCSMKHHLEEHMRVHTGEKPYRCDVCMKCFGKKFNLNKHMRMHTSDKPYKCDVCMKGFGQRGCLTKHMRWHSDDEPYKCDVCMKCFDLKCYLTRHMRMHTGEKPYKCDVCMKCFTHKIVLIKHMRVHAGDKPYRCDVCMKFFVRKDYVKTHMRFHCKGGNNSTLVAKGCKASIAARDI